MKVDPVVTVANPTLARIASRQLGVVTREQLLAGGLSPRSVDRRLEAGALERVGRGVYRVAWSPRSWEQLAVATQLMLGHGAMLSHTSAARVWGLATPTREIIELSELGTAHRRPRRGVVVHRVMVLERRDRTKKGIFRLTTVARTLVDLAGRLDAAQLARAIDDAICRMLVTPAAPQRTAAGLGARGRRGSATFRDVLEPWLGESVPDSVAEMAFLRLVAGTGVSLPVCQHEIVERGRFVARPDFVWPDRMLAVQVDGYRWHSSPGSFAKDPRQTNELVGLGWVVLHVAPVDIRHSPSRVIAAVLGALALAAGP